MPIFIKKKPAAEATVQVTVQVEPKAVSTEPPRPASQPPRPQATQPPRPAKIPSVPVTDEERERIRQMLGAKESPMQRGGADYELFRRVVEQTEARPCTLCGHVYKLPCDGGDASCTNKIWREQRLAAEAKEKA